MDAGRKEESPTTHPVTFSRKHLFVNMNVPTGVLHADLSG
jgi:hypothetical protein